MILFALALQLSHTCGPLPQLSPEYDKLFRKTRAEFLLDADEAVRLKPSFYSPPKVESSVVRLDERDPDKIRKARGLWPSTWKHRGTIVDHTGEDGWGSSSYVSFSWESAPRDVIESAGLNRGSAEVLIIKGKPYAFADHPDLSIRRPLSELAKAFGVSETDLHGATAVWTLYEYRMENIEGVRVHGGKFTKEREVVARGAALPQIKEFRTITVRKKLAFGKDEAMGDEKIRLLDTRGFDKNEVTYEYSDWRPF